MALWAMVVFVAPICGPMLGGWITDNFSWPWLFFLNVPVGIASVAVTALILRRRETRRVKVPVDVVGLVLLVIGVGALQYMLDNGNERDWFESPLIVAAAVTAVVALVVLVTWELTDRHPVLDLHLLGSRNLAIGITTVCFGFFCFFGAVVIYPLWLQTTLGYTATWAGLATAPVGLLGLLVMPIVGRNIDRWNLRVAATFGFVVLATVMFWISRLNAEATFLDLALPRLLQGVGLSFFFLPLQQIMFSSIRPDELASASGLTNFLRNLSGSVATAISVWLWGHRTDFHHSVLADHLRAGGAWNEWSGALAAGGAGDAGTLAYTQLLAVRTVPDSRIQRSHARLRLHTRVTHPLGLARAAAVPEPGADRRPLTHGAGAAAAVGGV